MSRGRDWIMAWANGNPVFDPVAAALVWSLILWTVAAWAGWAVHRRKQPLPAMVPAGILLGTTLAYTGAKATALLWFLGITLLVIAIVSQDVRQHRWFKAGIHFSPSLWQGPVIWATLLSLALVASAALTQSLSLQKLILFTRVLTREQAAQREQAAESLGLEQQPVEHSGLKGAPQRVRSPGLPQHHLIGTGPELSNQEVMFIRIITPAIPRPGLEGGAVVPRYYWRSNTYDRYTGRGWSTGPTDTESYAAGQPIRSTDLASHRLVKQEVLVIAEPSQLVFGAGTLVTTDQDFIVDWRSPEDTLGALFATPTRRSQVVSLVPDVNEDELRASGSDYPSWVRARYLTLPYTVPERVLALARDLTATAATPYDRALAIESYLRDFPYTLDLAAPPWDRDVVDFFLFDLQKGYCDYYATSMVVLARAAGLPARMVIGYSSGRYDIDLEAYVITEAQAHSWVEIYFPGYGWVEFEPTAGRPTRERRGSYKRIDPTEFERIFESEPLGSPRVDPESVVQERNWQAVFFILLATLASGGVAWLVIDRWRLLRLTTAEVATKIYRQMRRHSERLRAPIHNGDTPYELSETLAGYVTPMARDTRWGSALAPVASEVKFLTENYVQISYSPHKPRDAVKPELIRTWRRLRRRLWLAWIRARLWRRGKVR
ncbi:MAG: transglutaminase-like domain-containing protein, partial [Anaerolineales bacterium]